MSYHTVCRHRLRIIAAVLLILAVAALFRLWRIGSVPPGLFGDEAVNGLDALDVLAGRGRVFFPANYGREGLHMFFIAAFLRLLGVTPLAIRLPSVLAGILTTLATYWLGHELFESKIHSKVPLLAALWLATAYWHVHFSRFGIRGVFTPLCGALAFAAFWRGVNRQASLSNHRLHRLHRRTICAISGFWFLLSGGFLGLSIHFYTASRLYPIFLGLFLLVQAAIAYKRERTAEGRGEGPLLGRFFWPIIGLYAVAAAVFAPLGWYFLTHPGSFAQRASTVFAFSSQEKPWARIGQAVVGNVAQFFLPGHGDAAWFYNLSGRPLLEPVTAVLALVGLLICLRRWQQAPYLFLLLWWPTMLLPTFLAVDRTPTAPRALGVMPGLYFFPAIAIQTLVDWMRERIRPARLRRAVIVALLVIPLTMAAVWTAWDYFAVWAPSAEAYEAFDGEIVDAARWLQEHPQPWPVYLSAEFYRHMSFVLLYSQVPTTEFFTYRDAALRWFDGRAALPLPPPGEEATYIFTGIAHLDEERLARYLPTRQLLYQSFDAAGRPSVTVYRASYRERAQNPADVSLTDGVALTGYDIYGEARPGQPLEAALFWRFAAPEPENLAGYRVQLALVDENGHRWPAAEEPLAYRPPEWDAGSQAVSWHTLSLPGEAPLGAYRLAVRLADGESGAPVSDWAVLSSSEMVEHAPAEPLITFGESLRLLAADAWLETTLGGKRLVVELLLDTTSPLPRSYTLFLHALDADGEWVGQRDSPTGGGLFPTDAWRPGQPLRDIYRVPIEATEARLPYRLALGFYDWRTGERLPAFGPGGRLPDDQYFLEPQMERVGL